MRTNLKCLTFEEPETRLEATKRMLDDALRKLGGKVERKQFLNIMRNSFGIGEATSHTYFYSVLNLDEYTVQRERGKVYIIRVD